MNSSTNLFSIRTSFYYIFLIFVFFPFLQIIPTSTDMQPFAVISAICLFFCFKKKFSKIEVVLLFMVTAAFFLLFTGPTSFTVVRSFANYLSVFFISYVSHRVLRSGRVNFENFLFVSFLIWFVTAILQVIVDKSFLTFIVSASRTTESRGVTSLASEATFLGIVYVFYILFSLHLKNLKYRKSIIIMSIFGILFLAKSTMALLFLIILTAIYFFTHLNFKSLFLIALGVITISYSMTFLEGSRIYELFQLVKNDPSVILLVDASINDRFFHVYFSVKGFLENFFIPNGYNAWLPYVTEQLVSYKNIVIIEWFSLGGRIMSGFGSAFFELGFIALTIPLTFTYLLFNLFKNDLKSFLFICIFVNLIMFSAIPIGFPIFAFYLGFLSYSNFTIKKALT